MALLHSVLIAKLRHPEEGGEAYEVIASATGSTGNGGAGGSVNAAYQILNGNSKEGLAQRKRYSEAMLMIDNQVRANHEYADRAKADRTAEKQAKVATALEEKDEAAKAIKRLKEQLAAAEASEEEAAGKIRNLTGKKPLTEAAARRAAEEEEEARRAAEEEAASETDPVTPVPTGEEGAEKPAETTEDTRDPVEVISAKFESGDTVQISEIKALTIPQLTGLAERYAIELPKGADKKTIVFTILDIPLDDEEAGKDYDGDVETK